MIQFNDYGVKTDNEGYLLDYQCWNECIAEEIAKNEGIVLSDEHWLVIHFVRQFYREFNTSPAMRMLVNAMRHSVGEEKGNSRFLYKLFPDGPAKQATKIAGLPKPVKCI